VTSRTAGLESVLAGEHAAIYGYGVAGAVLVKLQAPVTMIAAARGGLDAHRVSRDRLSDAIATLGGTPPGALAAYQIPFALGNPAACLRLLITLEDRLCGIAGAAVASPDGRTLSADVLGAAAVRAAQLRLLSGLPASRAAVAFPGLPKSG
jgi:hypothetical protein